MVYARPDAVLVRTCTCAPEERGDTVRILQARHLTWFGTADTQAGQLGRLLELMTLPNVSLGIIPLMTERPAVASAGFWIFDNALVALETPTASIEVTQPGEIQLYTRMFDTLNDTAAYGRDARNLIIKTLNELDPT